MDLGSNFSARLEPFLLMGKSLKGAAAAKLIQDATSAPGVFVFGELLELANIRELEKNEQYSKFYSLLQLFAYKTYQDYLQHKDSLPPLNEAQTTKLKHLSIVSLASERRLLAYSDLLVALDVTSVRELEDLIIDGIYLDVLQGKLDQKEEQLEVEYTMGRDINVEDGGLEDILKALQNWASTTASVLATLDTKLASIASSAASKKLIQSEYDAVLQATLKDVSSNDKHGKDLGGASYNIYGGGADRGGSGVGAGAGAGGNFSKVRKMFGDRDRDRDRGDREYEPPGGSGMDVDEPVAGGLETRGGKNRKASQDSMTSKPVRKRNKF